MKTKLDDTHYEAFRGTLLKRQAEAAQQVQSWVKQIADNPDSSIFYFVWSNEAMKASATVFVNGTVIDWLDEFVEQGLSLEAALDAVGTAVFNEVATTTKSLINVEGVARGHIQAAWQKVARMMFA